MQVGLGRLEGPTQRVSALRGLQDLSGCSGAAGTTGGVRGALPAEGATQALFLAGWAGFRFGDQV